MSQQFLSRDFVGDASEVQESRERGREKRKRCRSPSLSNTGGRKRLKITTPRQVIQVPPSQKSAEELCKMSQQVLSRDFVGDASEVQESRERGSEKRKRCRSPSLSNTGGRKRLKITTPRQVIQVPPSQKSAEVQKSLHDVTCGVEGHELQESPTREETQLHQAHDTPASPAGAVGQLDNDDLVKKFMGRYRIGRKLGEGAYGVVHEGIRRDDGLKVAVKFVSKKHRTKYISIPGHDKPVPKEVALTILANKGRNIPQIIKLLDWQELPDCHVMVLERPSPCKDLFDFLQDKRGRIGERLAKIFMWHATTAAYTCCQRGVLHRDIKLENFLVNTDTLDVKLIDFGCGDLLKKSSYKTYAGTEDYCPPEFSMTGKYHGKPATVWSLGVLLFTMLCGYIPESYDLSLTDAKLWSASGLSKDCCDVICACLQQDPEQRLQLEEILEHQWFKVLKPQ